jgi:hypothetical protein
MTPLFDKYIQRFILEAKEQEEEKETPQTPIDANQEELPPEDLGAELAPEKPVFPEEMELAKLALQALNFNAQSKNVHALKLKIDGREIPFERISDYFESTKDVAPILGFIEWAINRYEGGSSKWIRSKTSNIIQTIKKLNTELPEEQLLDSNRRMEWTRIILNCLIKGDANFSLNISEVNEKTIGEIFDSLMQAFGSDSRGMFKGLDFKGPATF